MALAAKVLPASTRLRKPVGVLLVPSPRRNAKSLRSAMALTRSSRTKASTLPLASFNSSFVIGMIAVSFLACNTTSRKVCTVSGMSVLSAM